MKLRIKGNSIRFRLTKSEVDYFGKKGNLTDEIDFGCSKLAYSINIKIEAKSMSVFFEDNKITVYITEDQANQWVSTEKVGLNSELELKAGGKLYILIEKDFKCLDETIEDQSDNYPNPLSEK